MGTKADKVETVYQAVKEQFDAGGIHNFLWQVIVNDLPKRKPGQAIAFTVVHDETGRMRIGIAVEFERGYFPTTAYFKTGSYGQASDIADQLNAMVLDISARRAMEIVASSFRKVGRAS